MCESVCVKPCLLWEVCVRPCVLADVSMCVCVCVFTHRAASQAADIIHLLVTKHQGCWVGSRQPLSAEDGSWILIPPLLSPASHDGKSLTLGLENKAESFSQLAAVNAKRPNHILNKSPRDMLKSCMFRFKAFRPAVVFEEYSSSSKPSELPT